MLRSPAPLAPESLRRRSEALGPGSKLGRYEILAPLGRGGMAQVWLGRMVGAGSFERLLAIKTVHPGLIVEESSRRMFVTEARVAATVRHANVVDVFDCGEHAGILYQVLSLVEGDSLAGLQARLAGGLVPPVVLASIVVDALRGLHAAHESRDERGQTRHLVHRDVSPHNILVGLDGIARMTDFGVAKILDENGASMTQVLRGKAGYLAPEQVAMRPLDRRTDVFAMGTVLWEALTGARLFRGKDLAETIAKVQSANVPFPTAVAPAAPRHIAACAMRALEREPDRRYPSAEAMRVDLVSAAASEGWRLSADVVASFVDGVVGAAVRERVRRATSSDEGTSTVPDARSIPLVVSASVSESYGAPASSEATKSFEEPRPAALVTAAPVRGGGAPTVARRAPNEPTLSMPAMAGVDAVTRTLPMAVPAPRARRPWARVGLVAGAGLLLVFGALVLRLGPKPAARVDERSAVHSASSAPSFEPAIVESRAGSASTASTPTRHVSPADPRVADMATGKKAARRESRPSPRATASASARVVPAPPYEKNPFDP